MLAASASRLEAVRRLNKDGPAMSATTGGASIETPSLGERIVEVAKQATALVKSKVPGVES